MAPALADPPTVLIADEPTLGLAHLAAQAVMVAILELRDRRTSVLLAEAHTHNALQVADRITVMELGRIVLAFPREEASIEWLEAAYLGLSATG